VALPFIRVEKYIRGLSHVLLLPLIGAVDLFLKVIYLSDSNLQDRFIQS
jgi:hypothetical protein